MLSAIKSLFFIIIAIVVLVILFFLGLILLIRGFLKKQLAEYAGRKLPKVLMITGAVLISLPLFAIVGTSLWGITSSVSTLYNRAHYKCVPDIWRNESVDQSQAEEDIIKALLLSADKGSREVFCRNFTPELQKKEGFDKAVNDFFEAYPVGLSECDKIDETRSDSDADGHESEVKADSLSFRCFLGEKWYFVIVEYCYRNTSEPDKVGVTRFRVMNLEAAAVYYNGKPGSGKSEFPVCDIKSSSEIDARLVGGRPYLWMPTDTPKISVDLLRRILAKTNRLDDPILLYNIGEPNLIIKHDNNTEFGYFFELAVQNDEPRYVYFQTDSELGNILYAFLCTPYEVDYDNPLVECKE